MSDLFFDWIKTSWGESYLVCFKRGEISIPIFMLDKLAVSQLKEVLKEKGELAK